MLEEDLKTFGEVHLNLTMEVRETEVQVEINALAIAEGTITWNDPELQSELQFEPDEDL